MSVSSRTRSKLKQRDESRSLFLNLPEEVHDEVFVRVPAKSILSSRCVCKLSNNLLSKPNFINNHVNRTIHGKNKNPKLMISHHSLGNHPMIYSVPVDYALLLPLPSASLTTSPSAEFDGAVPISFPFESKGIYVFNYTGSCNGLICSRISRIDTDDLETKFCILNPLTREFKEFKEPENCKSVVAYGFGYDSSIGDYKLVIISVRYYLEIYIYTLRSDSWSSIQSTVKCLFQGGNASRGVFFNGCLHWLASPDTHKMSSKVIFCVDISNGIMVNMPLPENIKPPTDFLGQVYKNLGVWGDCIGIAFIWDSVRVDVWVMQEYGVKESWINKYTTTTTPLPLPLQGILFLRPLWCFNNGEILVDAGGDHLLLYEPTTERVRLVGVRGITMDNSRESYVESIVLLGSGTYLKKPIKDGVVKNSER